MADNYFLYDYNNFLDTNIGEKNGFSKKDVTNIMDKMEKAYGTVFNEPSADMSAVLDILHSVNVSAIKAKAQEIRQNCEYFVVLGIGGSSLCTKAIFNALCHPNHNELSKEKRNAPKFYVEDSVDPEKLQALLDVIELDKTIFCIVTKSGKTTETLAQFFAIKDIYIKQYGENWREHFIVITSKGDSFLKQFALDNQLDLVLDPPVDLGGRYSVFSSVGLLPAAVLGLDIDALLEGAKLMVQCAKRKNIWENAPWLSATFDYLSYLNGKNMSILIPYMESLEYFVDWFCQLWAESIGRKKELQNGASLIGQTPIKAIGPSAQHSQFQLYLEGPDDKILTFIGVNKFRENIPLPKDLNELYGQDVTKSRTFGDLINVERVASTIALKKFGKPSETIVVSEINENVLGKLFMFFMLKMAFIGGLLEINPFGQPSVESIKIAVASILKNDADISSSNGIEV